MIEYILYENSNINGTVKISLSDWFIASLTIKVKKHFWQSVHFDSTNACVKRCWCFAFLEIATSFYISFGLQWIWKAWNFKISNTHTTRYNLSFYHMLNFINSFEAIWNPVFLLTFINSWLANKVLMWKRNMFANVCKKQKINILSINRIKISTAYNEDICC